MLRSTPALALLLLAAPVHAQPHAAEPLEAPTAHEVRLVLDADVQAALYVVDGDGVGATRDDYALLCEAPCSPVLARGTYTLAVMGRDAVTAHLRAFVDRPRRLLARRDDRGGYRTAGVITLIAGIALSSVMTGVSMFGSFSQDDMTDEALGIGAAVFPVSLDIAGEGELVAVYEEHTTIRIAGWLVLGIGAALSGGLAVLSSQVSDGDLAVVAGTVSAVVATDAVGVGCFLAAYGDRRALRYEAR